MSREHSDRTIEDYEILMKNLEESGPKKELNIPGMALVKTYLSKDNKPIIYNFLGRENYKIGD